MSEGFWHKRVSRRRLIGGATSLAVVGGGALLLPRRSLPRSSAQNDFIIAEDIRHTPVELATGRLQSLRWDTPAGQPALRAASTSGGLYTSPIVKTSFPSTHIGLHWTADAPGFDRIDFEVRTSSDGWTWSEWKPVYIEAEPEQNPRGERFGALVWAGDARYVQYRASFPEQTPDATALRNVTVTAIAASAVSTLQALHTRRTPTPKPTAGATPGPTRNAGNLDPPFASGVLINRETWSAAESYRYDSRGYEVWPRMYLPTKKIVVHHTATLSNTNPQDPTFPYPNYSADQAVQDVRAIYYYHAITLGWGDIGYNALIDRFGRVFEGRRGRDSGPGGGREVVSPDVVAGHALNWNEGTCGVACIGNFEENQIGSNEQTLLSTLVEFLTWSCRRFYVWPNASSDFLQVNWVWRQGIQNISGHRDVNQTACPGQYLYAYLSNLRTSVAQRAQSVTFVKPSAQITSLPSQANIDAHSVTFAWKSPDSSSAEFSYYLEGWIPNLDTDEEYYICGFTADKRPDWSSFSGATSATLKVPQAGRYTFHVRARDSKTDGAYEANWTFVAQSGAGISRSIGVPGIVKN